LKIDNYSVSKILCPFLAKPHPFYLFYLCPSWDISIINKKAYGLDKKGTWKRGKRRGALHAIVRN